MKPFRIFIALFFISLILSAQDTIYKSDGTEIQAKVIEITMDVVKYKKFSNLDGPTYNIAKSDVFMIVYDNGEREVFKKTEEPPPPPEPVEKPATPPQPETPPPPPQQNQYSQQMSQPATLFSIMFKLGYYSPAEEIIDKIYGGGLMIGTGFGVWWPSGFGSELSFNGFFSTGEPIGAEEDDDAESKWSQLVLNTHALYRISTDNPDFFPYIGVGPTYISVSEELKANDKKKTADDSAWGFHAIGGVQFSGFFLEVVYMSTDDPDYGGFSIFAGGRVLLE